MESKNEGGDEEAAEIQSAEDDQGEAQVEEQEQDEDIKEEKVGGKAKRNSRRDLLKKLCRQKRIRQQKETRGRRACQARK